MTKLSVNLNKVALVRNSRGPDAPNLETIAQSVIAAGCDGLTLHPRSDGRHATLDDVIDFMKLDAVKQDLIEVNVEGDLRDDLVACLQQIKPHQFTIVPVVKGEKTTTRGWRESDDEAALKKAIQLFKGKTRISLFVEPEVEIVEYVHSLGADAVEFHTKWYAEAFGTADEHREITRVKAAADKAKQLGMRVHLGHDLNLENLPAILQAVNPDEVSIGHAIIVEALVSALPRLVKDYSAVCHKK